MIDSADRRRMEETGVELQQLLDEVSMSVRMRGMRMRGMRIRIRMSSIVWCDSVL